MSEYRTGTIPKGDKLFRFADALGVSPRWLATGEGGTRTSLSDADEDWVQLPRYDLFAFGEAGERPSPVEQVALRRDWLGGVRAQATDGLWLADMPSGALQDVAQEGETLVVRDYLPPIVEGRPYVLMVGGRPMVRKVSVRPEGLVLKATDPAIDPIIVRPDQLDTGEVIPVGRVLATLSLRSV